MISVWFSHTVHQNRQVGGRYDDKGTPRPQAHCVLQGDWSWHLMIKTEDLLLKQSAAAPAGAAVAVQVVELLQPVGAVLFD